MRNSTSFRYRTYSPTLLAGASLFFLFFSLHSRGQSTYSVSNWWGPAAPRFSPVVSGSGEITFRIKAPKADSVFLRFGEWDVVPQLLAKDSSGVWATRLGPIPPGIYSYLFSVDGNPTPDFANPLLKVGTEVYGSIVEVPGRGRPRFDEIQNVPHGSLQIHSYFSTEVKRLRHLYVYLPPSYQTNPNQRFPVLYLRHGGGDNESSWTQESGRADVILENLLAANEAKPMIIVMPNGLTDGSWAGGSTAEGMLTLEQELLKEIVPFIEKSFRTRRGANNRAIAGLSMGGGQAYIMGLRHPDTFSWIGEFSSGILSDATFDLNERAPGVFNNPTALNTKLKLLFIGCGTDDPRFPGHLALSANLKKQGIQHHVYNIPGGHEWRVWREQLRLFLTKLFEQ